MKIIKQKINEHYINKLPFVVYNKPNKSDIIGVFQQNDDLHTITNQFDQKGFVFAPFNSSVKTVLFPLEKSKFVTDKFYSEKVELNENPFFNDTSKEKYVLLVQKAIKTIKNNEFKKVVLSRKEIVEIKNFEVTFTYQKLLQTYPNAFVYVWFHPKVGLWFGATPETLLEVKDNKFTTMSLAGTQVYQENEKVKWNSKEIEEQRFVTDYIVHKLSSFSTDLQQFETETIKAGSLVHLRTEIRGKLDVLKNNSLFFLIDLLHPTPAVCGLPKAAAKQFILENENYNRSYYTGFLGELNMGLQNKNDSHLFVNLRCMEVVNNDAYIYIGGGITKESNPEKEWEETVAKSNIMLKVI